MCNIFYLIIYHSFYKQTFSNKNKFNTVVVILVTSFLNLKINNYKYYINI